MNWKWVIPLLFTVQDSEIKQSIEVVNESSKAFRFEIVIDGKAQGSYDCPAKGEVAVGYPLEHDRDKIQLKLPQRFTHDDPEWDDTTRSLTFTVRKP